MRIRFWGTRGSIATPGPTTVRYGGNTSCVELRSDAGTLVVLDCPDFAVAFDDLRFDFTDLFINKDADVFLAADDFFARFDNAIRTEGIGRAWPA